MIQSYQILGDWILQIPFWTEVQGWCNPTTFSGTEASRYLSELNFKDDAILPHSWGPKPPDTFLNRSSRMMQSCHILRDRSLHIPFWTEVQGWCSPATFSGTEAFRYLSESRFKDDAILPHSRGPKPSDTFLSRSSRMMQSYHILGDRSLRIPF